MNKLIKIAFSICSLALFSLYGSAQSRPVQHWEGGVFVGPNISLGKSPEVKPHYALDSRPAVGYTAGGEIRYNFTNLPLNVGLRGAFTKIGHDEHWNHSIDYWHRKYTNNWSVVGLGDWNFNRGSNVSPFIGIGAGMAWFARGGRTENSVLFAPRAGIELVNRFRVAVTAQLSKKKYNNMELTLGWAFGGTPLDRVRAKQAREALLPVDEQTILRLRRQSNTCMWLGVGALGIGIPTVVGGVILTGLMNLDGENAGLGIAVTAVGGAITLSSIPLFVVSYNKKAKAKRLAVGLSTFAPTPGSSPYGSTGVGLALTF